MLKVLLLLTSIITVAALVANLGLFGESEVVVAFAKWGMTSVLGVIITTAIGISKGLFTKAHRLRVSLDFESRPPGDVRLDTERCTYQLLDEDGNQIQEGKITPVPEGQSWECTLPAKAWESFYIKLNLEERGGINKWVVGPFYSFRTFQKAEVVTT